MTTFKPGDVVERVDDSHTGRMRAGSRHVVHAVFPLAAAGGSDIFIAVKGDEEDGYYGCCWDAEFYRLASQDAAVATVGKLRLFPASTALARGR